jgi:RHS repeat-associated protein
VVDSLANHTTTYVYDPDGGLLVRHDDNVATLYLPGQELVATTTTANGITTTAVTGMRYYTHNGVTVAVRSASGVDWLAPDLHGTDSVMVDASSQAVSQRRSLPFGSPRWPPPASWPGDKGFVGGTVDSTTGFTNLGAREYDPVNGRFLSADPMLDPSDPQQLNGYAYANNNPTSDSDPSGLMRCQASDPCNGGCVQSCGGPPAPPQNSRMIGQGFVLLPPPPPPPPKPPTPPGSRSCGFKALGCLHLSGLGNGGFVGDFLSGVWDTGVGMAKGTWDSATMPARDLWHCVTGSLGGCGNVALDAVGIRPAMQMAQGIVGTARAVWHDCTTGHIGHCLGTIATIAAVIALTRGAGAEADPGLADLSDLTDLCAVNSFSAGTPVLMADGSKKPIEQVKAGDRVMAEDPQKGVEKPEPATNVIIGQGLKHLYDIVVNGSVIEATYNHPFWVTEKRDFEWAQDLVAGEHLLLADGETALITAVSHHDQITTVYNLTVHDLHTYFAGIVPVLTHNICGAARDAGLPTRGPIRFIPPRTWRSGMPLLRGPGPKFGYIDRFGNIWEKGPSRTAGEPFEWDVILSRKGLASIGWLSRDGKHVNVSQEGWVTH